MSVVQTIKVVVVLLAFMAGMPTMAFAHFGHEHAAPAAASASGTDTAITATQVKAKTLKNLSLESSSGTPRQGLAVENPSSGTSIVLCTPGACCCQGASSCGSGHCCAFGIITAAARGRNERAEESFRLALLGWPYPDLIFGLDRPPKV